MKYFQKTILLTPIISVVCFQGSTNRQRSGPVSHKTLRSAGSFAVLSQSRFTMFTARQLVGDVGTKSISYYIVPSRLLLELHEEVTAGTLYYMHR